MLIKAQNNKGKKTSDFMLESFNHIKINKKNEKENNHSYQATHSIQEISVSKLQIQKQKSRNWNKTIKKATEMTSTIINRKNFRH